MRPQPDAGALTPSFTSSASQKLKKSKPSKTNELPYTFSCPDSHDDFLKIVADIDDADVPTVVKRIRALHHPSLAEDNKFKLQVRHVYLRTYQFNRHLGFDRCAH